ncbi:DUF2550 family protein [Pseudactinotalea sp. Z1732]|uniref:DUF2550 family protein n=1 Tax=Micrococcales TaxID=85006 RepID=UPI003C79B7C1
MATALIWIGGLLAASLLVAGLLLWRLHALGRRVGSFECAVREGEHWHAGIATYTRSGLDWHRVVSLSLRPSRRWDREELVLLARRNRQIDGRASRVVEMHCRHENSEFYLAAQSSALDGLVSWLEAAPPRSANETI